MSCTNSSCSRSGNALSLVHEIGLRASLDLDYSMEGDVEDADELGRRIFAALRARLEPKGFVVFDDSIVARPSKPGLHFNPKWGGTSGIQGRFAPSNSLDRCSGRSRSHAAWEALG